MNKRFASLAVSALLLVSLLSVPALAEGTEAAADAAGDDHVIVTLNPEAALQPETPAEAAASATETAQPTRSLLRTTQPQQRPLLKPRSRPMTPKRKIRTRSSPTSHWATASWPASAWPMSSTVRAPATASI